MSLAALRCSLVYSLLVVVPVLAQQVERPPATPLMIHTSVSGLKLTS